MHKTGTITSGFEGKKRKYHLLKNRTILWYALSRAVHKNRTSQVRFSPSKPDLIRPKNTYLIVIGFLQQIYNIVDSRYRSRKPLIVTTNLTLDEIRYPQDTAHARIYDRLLEMCVPVSCIGVSLRKENAQEKLDRMKLLLG